MTRRIQMLATPLPDLWVLERAPVGDARGWLERLYCSQELQEVMGSATLSAVNRTFTARAGTIRGMHFQAPPFAEDKIVTCLRGRVYDVAVDLRTGSPTFLRWHAEVLDAEHRRSLLIPKGFAHGFQTLVDDCELLYFHTERHEPSAEGGVDALDPMLAIRWPLPLTDRSPRDAAHRPLDASFTGISP
jgi:dTDP-4-dehydrorhamnose 3,5-epimerase